ncbi:hypothetical protein EU99_1801 [Prochlorococcus marinus str. MIT 9321]|uniref:Uncharacterized protein n=2 Tax=Prochlorococcus marinus TaxID=1219 RepID=A0A0A2B9F9_PROMR|nr:hypothetical protein [Prochlorococcus marinus]KGG02839.1 hypothetical protein EU99_1801 [Prochlorococcus marinus str. MIT 9321]KGG05462.1 hypothetical protein EV00_1096 [Prochlorococcus marinus str. MIT 9322]KGG10496.1 hypothetical protein EV01_0124 [Prochlorococcus marinus str. MIT 9401]
MNFIEKIKTKTFGTKYLSTDSIVAIIGIWCLGISRMPSYIISNKLNIPEAFVFFLIATFISFIALKFKNFRIIVRYELYGLFTSLTIFSLALISLREFLNLPLANDELVHYQKSLLGYRTLNIIIENSSLFNFSSTPSIWLIAIFNIIILSTILGAIFLIRKKYNTRILQFSYLSLYIFVILILYNLMGIQILDSFPILSRFPIWLSQVFLGISSTSARLPGLVFYSFSVGLLANSIYIDRNISNQNNYTKIIFFISLIASAYIPLNILTASLVEQSTWSTSAWLIAAAYFINYKNTNQKEYIKSGYFLITILSLIRFTSILVLPIYWATFLFEKNKKYLKDFLFFSLLSLTTLLQTITTLIVGNSSLREMTNNEKSINLLSFKKYIYYLLSSIGENGFVMIFIYCILFLSLILVKKNINFSNFFTKDYLILIALIWSPIIFLLTNENNYAVPRYFAEYLGGGIVIFGMLISADIISNIKIQNLYFSFIPLSIIALNSNYINYSGNDLNYLQKSSHFYKKRFDYPPAFPIKKAIQYMLNSRANQDFAIISQQKIVNSMIYIHAGASNTEIKKISNNQKLLDDLIKNGKGSEEILDTLNKNKISYLLVTRGNFIKSNANIHLLKLVEKLEEKGKFINTFNNINGASLSIYNISEK